jgi:hypothetical protein
MSGRGFGYKDGRGHGLGRGRGMGFGRGFGFSEEEFSGNDLAELKRYKEHLEFHRRELEDEIQRIESRISEMEK